MTIEVSLLQKFGIQALRIVIALCVFLISLIGVTKFTDTQTLQSSEPPETFTVEDELSDSNTEPDIELSTPENQTGY